jgi:nucleoid-associated protein YgaU
VTLLKNLLFLPATVAAAVAGVLAVILLLTPRYEPPSPVAPQDQTTAKNTMGQASTQGDATQPSGAMAPSVRLPPATAQRLDELRSARPAAPSRDDAQPPTPSPKGGSRKGPVGSGAAAAASPAGAAPAPVEKAGTYVVKRGDTPATIAREHLGDAARWPEIARANPGLDARSLQIGQVLRLPDKTAPRAATGAAQTTVAPLAVHRVAQGDTLYRLAAKYYGDSARWKLIQDANPGLPGGGVKELRLDSELIIPALPKTAR